MADMIQLIVLLRFEQEFRSQVGGTCAVTI